MIPQVDFELFYRLNGLYRALTLSATDPISLAERVGPRNFRNVFYDYVEDEKDGLRIVQDRIKKSGFDIGLHISSHDSFLERFFEIQEGANGQNRGRVVSAIRELIRDVSSYFLIVHGHIDRNGKDSFLHYPFCTLGYYFMVEGSRDIRELEFNRDRDFASGGQEVLDIKDFLEDFAQGELRIFPVEFNNDGSCGEELMDTSFSGRIELNKGLLRRAGMDLP